MALNKVLKVRTDSELLSFIINSSPELASEIDLPVQGQDIAPIGQLIVNNKRYKNAFINAINLIGLTVINRNYWNNPWEGFTNRGELRMGQSVREMIVDLAKSFDYNEYADNATHFLTNQVPDVYQYIHDVNFQKFYKTTTSDEQMAMAFTVKDGLFNLIEQIIGSLYEAYKYDKYIVDKYMLCRRIVDGTITSVEIDNYNSITADERVAAIKNVSSLMTFRNPNYNPAGLRLATSYDKQILIMNTDFESTLSTQVLAKSFFIDEARFKTNLALIDGFGNHDTARLTELLGSAYVAFSSDDLTALNKVPCVIISEDWFQDYIYKMDGEADGGVTHAGNFYNEETLRNNHWLHAWAVFSTSPFSQAVVFTANVTPNVTNVAVSPSTASVTDGQNVKLAATVTTTGFANKAVTWSIQSDSETDPTKMATVDVNGLVSIPTGHIKARSGTQGVYVLTISTALATGESIKIGGETYTASESDDTATKQATAIAALFTSNTSYTVTHSSGTVTFTEKSGKYGTGAPELDDDDLTTGVVALTTTTAGVTPSNGQVVVKATSVFKTSVNGTATITVS